VLPFERLLEEPHVRTLGGVLRQVELRHVVGADADGAEQIEVLLGEDRDAVLSSFISSRLRNGLRPRMATPAWTSSAFNCSWYSDRRALYAVVSLA
jgi:hypothetical protein